MRVAWGATGHHYVQRGFACFKPSWPLQFTVAGIATPDDESRAQGEPDEEPDDAASVVYVVEGGHPDGDSPYAPAWAFAAAQ